ncbi:hypothetical protein HGH93_11290 [Chitinophaga polysaccharea]|uniref:hemerythrin domain-containing protein n=1 Tax=Chitinophaga TaxID=79328 RepID=UPI001455B517|nr:MULTISPECIES: hemerythrin domain-containing protein [Chitinophaga]NLR58690.1 hypothetical protein [Chitinophaga polysaccharea]NLU91218.1 hypothetical protein [Chitinophaga sp. Ak27]
MAQLRFNVFKQAHKGLRLLLNDTIQAIQQTDFSILADGNACIVTIKTTLQLFHVHASLEDQDVFPMLLPIAPAVVVHFEKEHEKDEALIMNLHKIFEQYELADSPEALLAAGNTLLHEFVAFTAFNLEHMSQEECLLNPFLWSHYTDDEIMAIATAAVKKIPPAKNDLFIPWMLKGNSDKEVAQWLQRVKESAPAPAYERLYATAVQTLDSSRMQHITAVMEG